MSVVAPVPPTPRPQTTVPRSVFLGDRLFHLICLLAALVVPALVVLLVFFLFKSSSLSISKFGLAFFTSTAWDPGNQNFGALPFIWGTVVTSLLAMLIAVPLGVGAAAYLSEIANGWVRRVATSLIELLAAIPSVVYGFWGLTFLVPHLQPVAEWFGAANDNGKGLFTAGLLLSIMIVPYIAAISYDVCLAVPRSQREGSLALGATRWQVIRTVVLPYARPGIIGGCFLALGRALGETMAVAMLIGNVPGINLSLFSMGSSIPSVIAVELSGVDGAMWRSALIELGLVLFLVTVVVNSLARVLIRQLGQRTGRPSLWQRLRQRHVPVLHQATAPPADVPAVSAASPARARFVNQVMTYVLGSCLVLILIPLFHIFFYVVVLGSRSLDWAFFTNLPRDHPSGLAHALVGSALMVGMAAMAAVPVGVVAALYLSEYRTSRLAPVVRFVGELLGGVPSVIVGLLAYAILVAPAGRTPSAYAGACALAVLMIPVVMRSSEEALRLVPQTLRNASYALGATHWQTVVRVIVPAALPAIITGIFLALARIAGETAPLLFTADSSNLWPESPSKPTPYLTYYIYTYATGDETDKVRQAWAGALVLLVLVMAINISIRLVTGKRVVSAARAD